MRFAPVGLLALVATAAIACGGPGDEPTSTPTSNPVTVQVAVDTSKNPCQDQLATKPGTCYLPIYSKPTFEAPSVPVNSAPETKCTPKDERQCWPQPDTELKAVCKIGGMHIQDSVGRGSTTWYAVVVPPTELLIDRTLLPSTWKDEVVGFAPEVWLRKLTQQEVPSCDGVIAFG